MRQSVLCYSSIKSWRRMAHQNPNLPPVQRPVLPGIQRQWNYKLQEPVPVFYFFRRAFSLMSDLVLSVVYLNSYLPTTPATQCGLLLHSCFYIFENIIIFSISLLLLHLHSMVFFFFFSQSFLKGLSFIGLSLVLFSVLTFLHLVKRDKWYSLIWTVPNWNACPHNHREGFH